MYAKTGKLTKNGRPDLVHSYKSSRTANFENGKF